MINKDGKNELTPSQVDFCKRNIDGFIENKWHVSLAGSAGSDRRFLRIKPDNGDKLSKILIVWDSSDEDWNRFIKINREVSGSLNALPEIFTGMRVSMGVCWATLVAAEMVAATAGLGWMVLNAARYLRTDIVIMGVIVMGIIGYGFDMLMRLLENKLIP